MRNLFRVMFLVLLCSLLRHAQADFVVESFQILGSESINAGVNNSGQVVGSSYFSDSGFRATLWSGGTITNLGTLDGSGSSGAFKINDFGQVVGYSRSANDQFEARATLWSGGTVTNLGALGGNLSVGLGINNSGQVSGYSTLENGQLRATLWSGGTITNLGTLGGYQSLGNDINDFGQVVGGSHLANGQNRATLWSGGTITNLGTLGGEHSQAFGINDFGQVVGGSDLSNGQVRATLWSGGTMTNLGAIGEFSSIASDINNSGQVAGYSVLADGQERATLWSGGGIYDLTILASSFTSADLWNAQSLTDREDSGRFYLTGISSQGVYLMQIRDTTAVPEPSTMAMLGIATLFMGLIARRKSKCKA